jgi:hypothetical protein
VTAVALPGRIEQTLTLYGFLQLNPDVDFVRRRGRDGRRAHPLFYALGLVSLVYVFVGLFLAITCLPAFLPIGLPDSVPRPWHAAAAAAALAGALLAWRWIRVTDQRRRADLERQNDQALREGRAVEEFAPVVSGGLFRLLLVIAGGFLPVLVGSLAVATVNAVFDHSPPALEPVRLHDYRHETRLGLFRSYDVFWVDAAGKTQAISVPVTQVARFQRLRVEEGALERRAGFLGMPWVRNIHPVSRSETGMRRVHLQDGSIVDLER